MSAELREYLEKRDGPLQAKGKDRQHTEDARLDVKNFHRLLDRDDLHARGVRFSRGHLHRLMKSGRFPRPVKVGENRNAWIESEVDAWIAARIAERDAEAA